MLTKRIIPCLDIKEGRTVKGTNFVDLRDASAYAAIVAITIGKIVAGKVITIELIKYGRTPLLKDSVPSPRKTPL